MSGLHGKRCGLAALVLFILTIPVGNWVVLNVGTTCYPDGPCVIPVWPGLMSPSAVLLAGLALVLRDAVQSLLGNRATIAAILFGTLLSGLLSDPAVVIGSAAASSFGIGRLSRLHAASPPLSELGHSRLGPRGFDRRQLHLPAARLRVARIRDRTGCGQVLDESCRRGASLSLATPSRGARRRRRLRLRFARPNAFDPSVFRGARVFHWRRGNVALSFARQNEGTRLIWSPGT